LPINPAIASIEGLTTFSALTQISEPVDTVTLYVAAKRSSGLANDLIRLSPGRVIFNPGTENQQLRTILEGCGIHTEEACTLVLLNTDQF
jgi:hypothetical protein